MPAKQRRVFISHGGEDRWIASQISRRVVELGGRTFLDETDIPKGANFPEIIQREISDCDEVLALLTPWSVRRSWVWIEIGAAWSQGKLVVGVLFRMGLPELEKWGQGRGILSDKNIVSLNDIERYFGELAERTRE